MKWNPSSSSSKGLSAGEGFPAKMEFPGNSRTTAIHAGELNEMERCNRIINNVYNDIFSQQSEKETAGFNSQISWVNGVVGDPVGYNCNSEISAPLMNVFTAA